MITPRPLTTALVVVDVASTSQDFGFDISFLHSVYSVALSEEVHVNVTVLSWYLGVIVVRLNGVGTVPGPLSFGTVSDPLSFGTVSDPLSSEPQPDNINAADKVIIKDLFDINIRMFFR